MTDDFIEANRPVWRGLQFDSQLECDWAATLTVWGCDWKFHPGRIELHDGGWWEPDFLLKNAGAWGVDILLEVKGEHNERLWKAQEIQDRNPDLVVLIGRAPYLDAADRSQYPGAVWSRPDGSSYEWELNGREKTYVSGEQASYYVPGLIFFKAIGERQIR